MPPINIGNFEYTQDAKGNWIYKAKESVPISAASGKAEYKEKPQYPLQEEIEGAAKVKFRVILNKTILQTVSYIKNNLK